MAIQNTKHTQQVEREAWDAEKAQQNVHWSQKTIDSLIAEIAESAGCPVEDVRWWSWPQLFATTGGPRGAGGNCITEFQVYAFSAVGKHGHVCVKWCAGIMRHWDQVVEGRW